MIERGWSCASPHNSTLLVDTSTSPLRMRRGKRGRSPASMYSKMRFLLSALLLLVFCNLALSAETFKPFEFWFWVKDKTKPLPIRSPTLQVLFPSDFEVVDFRTGNGGPFYGTRREIDELQHNVDGNPSIVKGVFQFSDVLRGPSREGSMFDRSTNRFLFETKPKDSWKISNTTIEDMRRADTRTFPILLVKARYANGAISYSAHLILPDDAFVTITYFAPRVPTKLNEQIWEKFTFSIREL